MCPGIRLCKFLGLGILGLMMSVSVSSSLGSHSLFIKDRHQRFTVAGQFSLEPLQKGSLESDQFFKAQSMRVV